MENKIMQDLLLKIERNINIETITSKEGIVEQFTITREEMDFLQRMKSLIT